MKLKLFEFIPIEMVNFDTIKLSFPTATDTHRSESL